MPSYYFNRTSGSAIAGKYLQLHAMICSRKVRNYSAPRENTLHDDAKQAVLI